MKEFIKLLFVMIALVQLSGCYVSSKVNEKLTSNFNEKWKYKFLDYEIKDVKVCTGVVEGIVKDRHYIYLSEGFCFFSDDGTGRVYWIHDELIEFESIKIKYSEDDKEFKISVPPETKEKFYFSDIAGMLSEAAEKIVNKKQDSEMKKESWI